MTRIAEHLAEWIERESQSRADRADSADELAMARLARSVDALERLASYVLSLPGDDDRLAALAAIEEFEAHEAAAATIRSFGLRRRTTGADLDAFLDELVEALAADGVELLAD